MIGCLDQSKTIGEDKSEMTLSTHVTHLSSVCKRVLRGYLEKKITLEYLTGRVIFLQDEIANPMPNLPPLSGLGTGSNPSGAPGGVLNHYNVFIFHWPM
ncbi:unnamed protein product [Schistosoma spindalis]|nr:unnamed protein product [Schistosoma spindale]